MTQIVIYPGTFDPLTNGHVDIVQRAVGIFEQVVIAVAESAGKHPRFSIEERVDMSKEVFKNIKNVRVESFSGLLVDFAKAKNATLILRGLRCASDFDFEFQLAGMNRTMSPDIETIYMSASKDTAAISSSVVREIVAMGGDVSAFVPPAVASRF